MRPPQLSVPPNLLGKATPDPADHCRILASMEHGGASTVRKAAAAARGLGRAGVLALAAVLLLALLGWLSYYDTDAPPAERVPIADAGLRADAAPAQTSLPEAPDTSSPAAIINDIVAPLPPVAARAPAAVTRTAAPAPTRKPAPSTAAPRPDSDVTLLAALVAHTKGQEDTPWRGSGAAEVNGNVAPGRDGAATAELLLRCKQLALADEVRQCRARVCAGRWDGDAACK